MFVELLHDHLGQKAGTRIDVSDADGQFLIAGHKARAVAGDPLSDAVGRSISEAMGKITGGLEKAVDVALARFAQAQTKSRRHAAPEIFGDGEGDPKRTFGAFLIAVKSQDRRALDEMGSQFVEWGSVEKKAALSTQGGAAGGYTVPTEFYRRLMQVVLDRSFFRQMATVIPMAGRTVQVPLVDATTAPSAGDTATLGGLVARWTEENADKNETEPAFKQAELTNYELSGYSKISNSLLADNAVGLEAFLYQIFGKAVAWYEEYAYLRGNGVGKPLGVLSWAGLIGVDRSAADAFALADYANVMARWLPNFDPKSSCWACHPTVLAKLLVMNASGTGSPLIFIDNVRERPVMMMGGLPIHVTEKLPSLNTLGDILLMDVSQYLIGDRQQIEVAFSEHVAFLNNQTVWRFVSRVGGMPWLRDKITLADAATTLSPFVGLNAG